MNNKYELPCQLDRDIELNIRHASCQGVDMTTLAIQLEYLDETEHQLPLFEQVQETASDGLLYIWEQFRLALQGDNGDRVLEWAIEQGEIYEKVNDISHLHPKKQVAVLWYRQENSIDG